MRKLVDAPRKKKQWTEKEEAYLQDKWGTVSIKGLSKALGRSENAIIVRAQRLGCGAHLAGDTRISLNQLMLAIYGKNMLGYTTNGVITATAESNILAGYAIADAAAADAVVSIKINA